MSATANDGAWLLEARSVSRRFGGLLAVDAVDLAVRRASVHALEFVAPFRTSSCSAR